MDITGNKKEYTGVMLHYGKFYVVVTCCDNGDKRLTYVLCPFPSCKFGFVDLLDHTLKLEGFKGVLSYDSDDDLTYIVIGNDNANLGDYLRIVDVMLGILSNKHGSDVTDEMAKAMRKFVLDTHRHWMTRAKYDLLTSIINELH